MFQTVRIEYERLIQEVHCDLERCPTASLPIFRRTDPIFGYIFGDPKIEKMKEKYVCPDKTVLEGVVHPNRARSVEGEHRVLRRKEVRGQAHLCVAGLVGQGGGMRERDNTLRAIHPTRPHTVGYIGVCDQGGDRLTQNAMSEGDTWPTSFPACPLGPLGSSSSQHRRTLELILQEGSAVFSSIKPKVRNRTQSAAKRMQRLSTIALW